MLKNCVNKLPLKNQTAMQDSPQKIVVKNCSSNDVSIMYFADEKIFYPATYRIADCTQLSQQRKKTLQQH